MLATGPGVPSAANHFVGGRRGCGDDQGIVWREVSPLVVLTHEYSGYVGTIVLVPDIQSIIDDMIRYYLKFLEKRLYTIFFD